MWPLMLVDQSGRHSAWLIQSICGLVAVSPMQGSHQRQLDDLQSSVLGRGDVSFLEAVLF
jgi:hypothetical protein